LVANRGLRERASVRSARVFAEVERLAHLAGEVVRGERLLDEGGVGFVPAASVGIESPNASWGNEFQVRTLSAYDPRVIGRFRYAPAFNSV
jgi:hypothetical protein